MIACCVNNRIPIETENSNPEDPAEKLKEIIRSTLFYHDPAVTVVSNAAKDSVLADPELSVISEPDISKLLSDRDDEPSYLDDGSVEGWWIGGAPSNDDDLGVCFASDDVGNAVDADAWAHLMSMGPMEQALWDDYHNMLLGQQAGVEVKCDLQELLQKRAWLSEEVATLLTTVTAQQVIATINNVPKFYSCSSSLKQFLCFGVRMFDVSLGCLCSNYKAKNLYAHIMRYTPASSKVIEIAGALIRASADKIDQNSKRLTQLLWADDPDMVEGTLKIEPPEAAKYHEMNRLQNIAMQMLHTEKGAMLPFQLIKSSVRDLVSHGAFALTSAYVEGRQYRIRGRKAERCELDRLGQQYLERLQDSVIRTVQEQAFQQLSDSLAGAF